MHPSRGEVQTPAGAQQLGGADQAGALRPARVAHVQGDRDVPAPLLRVGLVDAAEAGRGIDQGRGDASVETSLTVLVALVDVHRHPREALAPFQDAKPHVSVQAPCQLTQPAQPARFDAGHSRYLRDRVRAPVCPNGAGEAIPPPAPRSRDSALRRPAAAGVAGGPPVSTQVQTFMLAATQHPPRSMKGVPCCGAGFPGSAGILPARTIAGLRPAAGRMPALPGGRPRACFHSKPAWPGRPPRSMTGIPCCGAGFPGSAGILPA